MKVAVMSRVRTAAQLSCSVGLLCGALLLTGCGANPTLHSDAGSATASISGRTVGGQQPVSGSTIQLYAAGTSGYGAGAQALLSTPVITDQYGSFSIPEGAYNCRTSATGQALPANVETYIVATGGNPGLAAGTNNNAIALMAALGPCSDLGPSTFIVINEITTVASVFPLAPFMGYGAQMGTVPDNTPGLAASFANVNFLANIATGQAPGASMPPGITVPVAEINTLGDMLAPCVNSDGSFLCSVLFAAATPPGGSTPTNTLDAALDIALNPANNVSALFGVLTPAAPFQPTLASTPANWSLGSSILINPIPAIASLSPASLIVGSAAQTLTINGSNFLPTSTVTYNGSAHPATYISADQLQLSLSASDLYALGSYPVVVTNPVPGGGTSPAASLPVYGDAANSPIVGSIVPSPAYELDALDVEGNYAYILGDNQTQGPAAAQFYVVDITNPAAMTTVSATPVIGYINFGQSGIRAQGHYVYLLSSTGAASTNLLQVVDVSNPSAPSLTGSVEIPLYALGLWVSGNYAYVISYVGGVQAGTLSIVDISNPASPTIVGSVDTGIAGVHVADIKVVGSYAYVSGQSGQTSYELLFDISNPASPFFVSSLPVEHSPQGLDIQGRYWYQTIYDANLLTLYDVSVPSSLNEVGSTKLSATCYPQDVSVEGSTALVSCYASSSLAVVDVSSPVSPIVDGYISLPGSSHPLFTEARGRYVYSISNTVGGQFFAIDMGAH